MTNSFLEITPEQKKTWKQEGEPIIEGNKKFQLWKEPIGCAYRVCNFFFRISLFVLGTIFCATLIVPALLYCITGKNLFSITWNQLKLSVRSAEIRKEVLQNVSLPPSNQAPPPAAVGTGTGISPPGLLSVVSTGVISRSSNKPRHEQSVEDLVREDKIFEAKWLQECYVDGEVTIQERIYKRAGMREILRNKLNTQMEAMVVRKMYLALLRNSTVNFSETWEPQLIGGDYGETNFYLRAHIPKKDQRVLQFVNEFKKELKEEYGIVWRQLRIVISSQAVKDGPLKSYTLDQLNTALTEVSKFIDSCP